MGLFRAEIVAKDVSRSGGSEERRRSSRASDHLRGFAYTLTLTLPYDAFLSLCLDAQTRRHGAVDSKDILMVLC